MATLGLALGYQCNIRCRHCLWGDTLDNPLRMTVADACSYIDQAEELGNVYMIGFTGGESFIFKDVMQKAMLYAARTYGLPSIAGSNSSFATSFDKARRILERYRGIGLRRLQLSVDDFHQEWVSLERVRNAVQAAVSLEIKVTLVCITTERTRRSQDFLREMCIEEGPYVEIVEAPCTPTGFATTQIDPADFRRYNGVPSDWCSMLRVINVLPDGSVQLCCGAPFSLDALKAGNAKKERLKSIISRAQGDPLMNALSAGHGVKYLVKILEEIGMDHVLKKDQYRSSCDACQDLITQPEILSVLNKELEKRREEMLIARFIDRDLPIMVMDECIEKAREERNVKNLAV